MTPERIAEIEARREKKSIAMCAPCLHCGKLITQHGPFARCPNWDAQFEPDLAAVLRESLMKRENALLKAELDSSK